jgi:uncharacterized protein (DUF58 family)
VSSALSPEIVAGIDDLELAARVVVEGVRAGGHRSPYHGYSAEFQQHRAYRPGDDLRYVDWKMLARSDKLYSRQFRETTSMSVLLVLDTSASMAYPEAGVSKFRYAVLLAAALAYLVTSRGDAVGIVAGSGNRPRYLAPRSGRAHLQRVLAELDGLQTQTAWDAAAGIGFAAERLRRPGAVVALSDFYDDENSALHALHRAARGGHDVAMLQLTSEEERGLQKQRGAVEYVDMESGRRLVVDAAAAAAYADAIASFHERCRTAAHRDGIDYALISTATPPARALREYLLRRSVPAAPAAVRQ